MEEAGYQDACFDPVCGVMSEDCSTGTATVDARLRRFALDDRWCFVESGGRYHGTTR